MHVLGETIMRPGRSRQIPLSRRRVLAAAGAGALFAACGRGSPEGEYHGNNFSHGPTRLGVAPPTPADPAAPFRLKFAPHFGMFEESAGADFIAQLEFAAEQGFRAWEDNYMPLRSPEDQQRLGDAMRALGIEMGVFVAGDRPGWQRPTLTTGLEEHTETFLEQIQRGIEAAKRVNATWMTILPGQRAPGMPRSLQKAHIVDNLRRAADLLEPHGLVMALEPMNTVVDFPNVFLDRMADGYLICKAVDSPACKLLFDIYHHQIMDGNILAEMESLWDEVCYIQIADNPGRNEPMSGEINYTNVLQFLVRKGYTGVVGMEHGVDGEGAEGEAQLIARYRAMNEALAAG